MIFCARLVVWSVMSLGLFAGTCYAATENYVVVSTNKVIGTLAVMRDRGQVAIDYRIDNNGRGAKVKEIIRLDKEGIPLDWRIEGTRNKGAPLREQYHFDNGEARWETLSDKGNFRSETPPLYVTTDASPWSYGFIISTLQARPDHQLNVLPGGVLRSEKLRDMEVTRDDKQKPQKVGVYALWGISMSPELILIKSDGAFFGTIEASLVVVPVGYEGQYEKLVQIASELNQSYLVRLTKELLHHYDRPLYLRNVRVFDSKAARLGEPTTVVVAGDRIASIRSDAEPPVDAVVVNGEGGTLLPGLTDMHSHISMSNGWDMFLHLAGGVTSIRDVGGDNKVLPKLAREVREGVVMGPRINLSGFLERESPYAARYGFVIDTLPEALDKVHWYADHGYSGIKIYNSMTPDWVQPIATEAHRLGLHVSGHVPAFMTSERAVRSGYDEINHINQLLLSFVLKPEEDTRTPLRFTAVGERMGKLDLSSAPVRQMIGLMRERGTAVDVTMAGLENMLLTRPGYSPPSMEAWLTHMPGPVQRDRRTAILDIKPEQIPQYQAAWVKLLEAIKLLYDSGIQIVPGTDDIPGFTLHSELGTYGRAGIPKPKVLQLATIDVARFLGQDYQLGSVERGKLADMILVCGDPTQDLDALRNVRMVVTNGNVIFPEEIYARMGIKPFGHKPPLSSAPVTQQITNLGHMGCQ